MYKEIVISILIVITIVLGDYFTQGYTEKSMTELQQELAIFQNMVKEKIQNSENTEDLNQKLEEIHKQWDEMYTKLAYYIEHDELEKIETELMEMKGKIQIKLYEETVPEIEKSIFILQHIKDKERLMIQNIF